MNRFTTFSFILLSILACAVCKGQDAALKELERAKSLYEKEKEAAKASALDAFDRREDVARKAGDKKSLDRIKAERKAFEQYNAVASNMSPAAAKRKAASQSKLEAAFNAAVKAAIRAKNDELAESLTKQLQVFRGSDWPHLDLESVTFAGDAFQIGKSGKVSTKDEFSGPIEVNVTIRTEKDNIRLHGPHGACVIFNWEVNPGELRVTRPDGSDGFQTGTLATASVTPLKPGVWYKLRWHMDHEGLQIYVNDDLVFSEERTFPLILKSRPAIHAVGSILEVRDFHIVPLSE